MNREQRRKQSKDTRRNSKKNFNNIGYADIPLDQIQHDENLKECDDELLELMAQVYEWQDKAKVKNCLSKGIITKGCSYLDSLCSLRFDITPPDDRVLVRDTMYYVANLANMFLGMLRDSEYEPYNIYDKTIMENVKDALEKGESFCQPLAYELYDHVNLPNGELVDDIYASFVVKHANELIAFLYNTRKSEIVGDESYITKVLHMVLKKTDVLLPEAQVASKKFIVEM